MHGDRYRVSSRLAGVTMTVMLGVTTLVPAATTAQNQGPAAPSVGPTGPSGPLASAAVVSVAPSAVASDPTALAWTRADRSFQLSHFQVLAVAPDGQVLLVGYKDVPSTDDRVGCCAPKPRV